MPLTAIHHATRLEGVDSVAGKAPRKPEPVGGRSHYLEEPGCAPEPYRLCYPERAVLLGHRGVVRTACR